MSFLETLGDQISAQFSVSENTERSLDTIVDGKTQNYGKLGDFAKQIDQSAERKYVENGYLRLDPYNTNPKQFEILMQEPNASVFIKKRMFSSIAENYRPDFMDADEKLYYKAMKVLFQNKCRQIASLEKLSKIQKITSAVGNISDQLLPIIISLTDELGGAAGFKTDFIKVVDRVRSIYAFNNSSPLTNWTTNSTNLYQTQFGQGTGVIEITNFTNLSTNVGLDIKTPGDFSLSISDPYEAMLITEWDIEKAITDASNSYYNTQLVQLGLEDINKSINDLSARLTQLRSDRKVSPLSFKVSPDTLLGKRVVCIIDRLGSELPFSYNSGFVGIGSEVTVAEPYLQGGAVAGIDGLSIQTQFTFGADSSVRKLFPDSELAVFKRLVLAIFNKLQLESTTQTASQVLNKNTNNVRRKLRFNFNGKLIIQPMDSVHIYLSSKSRYDNKLLSGLSNMFAGAGILQNVNKTFTDFKNAADSLFNPAGSINFQVEKSSFVGSDFPNYLWALMRNQFVTEKEGVHVFAGVVDSAVDNWSDGKFTIDVRGKDNSAYFDMGKVNFKPGIDVFNGSLFDPLTPFKTNFDRITSNAKDQTPELLDENKYLLGNSQDVDSPLVRFKLGPFANQRVTQDNSIQDSSFDKTTGFMTKTFFAPDGLVYKWKEGIGVLVQFGNSLELNDPKRVGNPALTKEPFAGQDIMNVISLLITGQPYNFANYWKAVANFDGAGHDPQSQQDSAYSYYASLKNDLIKNNITWGNFIPFKNLVMDEQSYAQALQAQFRILKNNQDLDAKLKKLADLNKKVLLFGAANAFVQNDTSQFSQDYTVAASQRVELQNQINGIIASIDKDDQSHSALMNIGNDTSFDLNQFLDSSKINGQASDPTIRRQLRRQINHLTRRMSYNVRANEDKNLFIVDDFYDKDYDILAYEQSLTDGLRLYNNEFNTVREKIVNTADLISLEVFCDTQGHIRVRPPQYNRMPSSVFYRMMHMKRTLGIQVFPEFIDDFLVDQMSSLKQRLEIIEDQIRLYCAILGINDDAAATDFILSNGSTSNSGDTFAFVSDTNGQINDIQNLIQSANPDVRDADVNALKTFTTLEQQSLSTKDVFSNNQRFIAINKSITDNKLRQASYGINDIPQFSANTKVDDLVTRIQTKSGQKIPKSSYLVQAQNIVNNDIELPQAQSIDVFKVTEDLAERIRERQKVMKLFYGAIKNSQEIRSLDDDAENTSNNLLAPGNYSNSNIPEVFEHMIEDESYDDLGPGSGSRYIIKRAQIRNLSISENPPPYTMIQVVGQLDPFLPNSSLPAGLNSFPENGNGLVTAAAVDYDMWRNYGFRQASPLNAPFLKDPNYQCAPYAAMMLSRARRNILQGTVTISGNEYMQPGEVVFLEDRNMLFYVSSVKHNFTFGQTFTTTLNLTYGHCPGEYIPVPLDVFGKLLYNNRDSSSIVVQRQSNSSNDSNIGIVQRDPVKPTNSLFETEENNSPANSFSANNTLTINNILYTSAYMIQANNTKGNTIQASVELRIYYDNNNPVNNDLLQFAETVKKSLTEENEGPKQPFFAKTGESNNPRLNKQDVNVVLVNMSDDNDGRSPSQKAIDAARNQLKTTGVPMTVTSSGSLEKDRLRLALFNYTVDCWLKFEPVPPQVAKVNEG